MAIHNVQESFHELLAAEKVVKDRLANLRKLVGDSIRKAQVPGVTPIPGTVNCCAVSFSAIKNSHSLCLSPKYYIQESQAKAVDDVLASRQTASSFLAALADMIHSSHAKARGGEKVPLNNETLEVLRELFNNLNV